MKFLLVRNFTLLSKNKHKAPKMHFSRFFSSKPKQMRSMKRLMRKKHCKLNIFKGFFAKLENYDEAIMKLTKSWATVLLKNKVLLKGITPNVEITKKAIEDNPGIYQEIKFVDPKKYSSNISIDCIHNFVRIIDYKNLNGVIIENVEVTNTVKQIFEMVWSSLE